MPIIFLLCTVGAFANASRLFDIYAMLVIGIGAFFLRRRGYQMAPFVLGLVLGPLLDKSLRRGLVLSDGSVAPFFTRPICARLRGRRRSSRSCSTCRRSRRAVRRGHRRRRRRRARAARPRAARRRRGMKLALCNEVLADDAARARSASSPPRSATTASRSRRSRSPTRPSAIDAPRRARIRARRRRRPASSSPACTGCWSSRPGLSLTDPDAALRARTLDVMARLIALCAELGGTVLVHGSPKQRAIAAGETHATARGRLAECLAASPRSPRRTASSIASSRSARARDRARQHRRRGGRDGRAIGARALRTMIDCSAAGADRDAVGARADRPLAADRADRPHPGQRPEPARARPGRDAFAPILAALERNGYAGVVSVEPFDYVPDGPGLRGLSRSAICAACAEIDSHLIAALADRESHLHGHTDDSASSCTASPAAWA